MVTLRELRLSDAPSLLAMLSTEEVARFISPPPTTVDGFERFIAWTHRERAAGNYVCFGVVPHGMDTAIGIFQVRQLEPGFGTAEWGFAIGSEFWGTGGFMDGAKMVVDFAFNVDRHAPARGAGGGRERSRQRRAPQGGRAAGGHSAQVLPPQRRIPRPDVVDDPGRGLAPCEVRVGSPGPLIRGSRAQDDCRRRDRARLRLFSFAGNPDPAVRVVPVGSMTLAAVFPPMVTPFADGEVDAAGHPPQRRRWMRAGLGGVVALGTNGEAALLDEEEADRVLGAVRDAVPRGQAGDRRHRTRIDSRHDCGRRGAPPHWAPTSRSFARPRSSGRR